MLSEVKDEITYQFPNQGNLGQQFWMDKYRLVVYFGEFDDFPVCHPDFTQYKSLCELPTGKMQCIYSCSPRIVFAFYRDHVYLCAFLALVRDCIEVSIATYQLSRRITYLSIDILLAVSASLVSWQWVAENGLFGVN